MKTRKATIPEGSLLAKYLPADYSDSYTVEVTGGERLSPDDLQVSFWIGMPPWVDALMGLRDALVRPFGLQSGRGEAAEFEKCIRTGGKYRFASVPAKSPDETVLLLSERHLDAYLSMLVKGDDTGRSVTATTLVYFHNRWGRIYFGLIRPFHGIIVRSMLRRAAQGATRP